MPKSKGMASYAMLSQDGDERDREITRGLGRPLRYHDPVRRNRCCKPWIKWTFVTLVITFLVAASVLIPLAFLLSPDVFPLANYVQHGNTDSSEITTKNTSTSTSAPETVYNDATQAPNGINLPSIPTNGTTAGEVVTFNGTSYTVALINTTFPEIVSSNVTSSPVTVPNSYTETMNFSTTTSNEPKSTNSSSFYDSVVNLKKDVYDWAERTFSQLPLIPTVITASAVFLALTTILWLVLYRRIVRRQRRRAISKMITDLQTGDKSVLLSNSSDEE